MDTHSTHTRIVSVTLHSAGSNRLGAHIIRWQEMDSAWVAAAVPWCHQVSCYLCSFYTLLCQPLLTMVLRGLLQLWSSHHHENIEYIFSLQWEKSLQDAFTRKHLINRYCTYMSLTRTESHTRLNLNQREIEFSYLILTSYSSVSKKEKSEWSVITNQKIML